jgi:hypothetical protein
MCNQKNKAIRLNCSLTRMIVKLHEQGYAEDFIELAGDKYLCLNIGREFLLGGIEIRVVNQFFDKNTRTSKYLHTVDTLTGIKGILVSNGPCFNMMPTILDDQQDAVLIDY